MYRIGFVVEQVLGHKTHGQNLKKFVQEDGEIDAAWCLPDWDHSSWARSLPIYRSNWTFQASIQVRRSLGLMDRTAKLDGLFFHTQVTAVGAQDWLNRIPGIVSLDATPMQYDSLGAFYEHARGPEWLEQFKWKLNRDCFLKAKKLVTWSEWTKGSLIKDYSIPADKIVVIPPGVNTQAWANLVPQPASVDHIKILFVGGNLKRKGGDLLVEVFRQIRSNFKNITLELHLVTKDTLPDEPGVFIYNALEPNSGALINLYHSCDIFCLPTLGDCLPMVLSEAGAAGLPVISTRVAAIPELVIEGETGLLVTPGNGAELAAALIRLIENPEMRLRFGVEAKQTVCGSFDAAKNASRLLSLIKQTIAE
jgi:glycosyltransferase involved in cell wall biosynthesis